VHVNRKKVKLNLCDTAGQEDYDRLRPLSYTNTDILLVMFDLGTRESFENVSKRWIPEAREHTSCPWVLVGTKSDCEMHEISFDEANTFAEENGAKFYMEISALKGDNMKQLFERSVRVALDNKVSAFKHSVRRNKYRFVHNHTENTCRVACKTGCILQ
jgi:small GTP-binding protein